MVAEMINRPKVVTLFAGIGGMSLGIKKAGLDEILAIDWLKSLEKSWEKNFPDTDFWSEDIMKINGNDILKRTRLKKGELDCLAMSPPCQGFSASGNLDINDNRNFLFFKSIDILNQILPKTFIAENVCGIMNGKMKGIFKSLFKKMSLKYKVEVKKMNAVFYECATVRPRIIWIGTRKDIKESISFPEPSKKILKIKDVINGVKAVTYRPITSNFLKIWEIAEPGKTYSSLFKISDIYFNYRKVSPFLPCPTITKTSFKLHHWAEPRSLSIEELKRIASFPDDFVIVGSPSFQWNVIGESVMPNFAKAIFLKVKEFLEKN